MTNRTKTNLAALGVLLVLVLVLFKLFHHWPSDSQPNSSASVLRDPGTASTKEMTDDQSGKVQVSWAGNSNAQVPTNANADRLHKLEMAVAAKNVAIQFWGRVIDQDGQPLPGVRVVMSARKWHSLPEVGATHAKVERITDSGGSFEIEGVSGDVLSREILEKPGYRLSQNAPISFSYGQSPEPFNANPREPIVFRMWKSDPVAGLISRRKLWGVVPDGRVYTFDLLDDTKVEGEQRVGDLRVRMIRPATVGPRDKFEWTLEIQGINGGLVETHDEFQFRAPESGYVSSLAIKMDPANADWTSVLKRAFYLSSRAGEVFAVVRLEAIPDYNDRSAINIEAIINPYRSRNLEPK
jgi:hypothetical protein